MTTFACSSQPAGGDNPAACTWIEHTERRGVMERTFGWLSHWGGLHRERAGRLDVATGRLACVASLMAASALNNPA